PLRHLSSGAHDSSSAPFVEPRLHTFFSAFQQVVTTAVATPVVAMAPYQSRGQSSQGFAVLVGGLAGDFLRQGGRWGFLVPAGGVQPIAHELLVEAGRVAAFAVSVGWPEAARIWGQNLVHQGQGSVFVEAELELGVGDDDSARGRVFDGGAVQGDGKIGR